MVHRNDEVSAPCTNTCQACVFPGSHCVMLWQVTVMGVPVPARCCGVFRHEKVY
ncbi:hypothetical protein HTIA_1097 [Halorhabdus tiamatea SARL4B]|uniref:Uncharacterized protein n=1 Tax=Halorhabdus tiamatea SARL4B TaxID=1033806 RepID=S6D2G9_9EURY|nr:hypothetical protein HTIA_1097 [Halorhabdus tiamatea SARL4B]